MVSATVIDPITTIWAMWDTEAHRSNVTYTITPVTLEHRSLSARSLFIEGFENTHAPYGGEMLNRLMTALDFMCAAKLCNGYRVAHSDAVDFVRNPGKHRAMI